MSNFQWFTGAAWMFNSGPYAPMSRQTIIVWVAMMLRPSFCDHMTLRQHIFAASRSRTTAVIGYFDLVTSFTSVSLICIPGKTSKQWKNVMDLRFSNRISIAIGTWVPKVNEDKSFLVILRHFAASLIGYQPNLKEILCGLLYFLHWLAEVNMLLKS